ncbi:GATOR complex protein WDR24-like [Actinia tenebrosa]|uniref:GATOR2 complex protein WDR24 n=1 Tax=Actinia tenebrosa TaxID=6105 RepID=A0A6P8IUS7_ACTTE|nr:GATOR complex protein WDR24-like [Actinia tenebrosa]
MSWEIVERPSIQEMAKVQDKGLMGCPSKTSFITLDGPINSFCSSKDGSQIAVAGRNVFKIISVDQDHLQEKINLRVGRINLNFSITDVQWHPVEDHILATAAGNGAVVIWNLNKITKQKQELVFSEHKRTVNRIKFHPVETNLLLSAGQDGNMKCFDLRKQSVAFTCGSKNSDIIRDVEFSPFDGKLFTAACETGNVQMWDMRRTDMHYHQFMAHNGPIFTIDWHPEERNWIATGGRDKFVKVWDVQCKASSLFNDGLHGIQAITSVGRIKWRPQRKYQIASVSLLVDFDIHIWDMRRPYIPYATFNEHKDTPTGIMWRQTGRGRDPIVLLSCSKDSTLYQHVFSDANHPVDDAPPVAISLNVNGDLSYAMCDQITNIATQTNSIKMSRGLHIPSSGNSLSQFRKKFHDISDNFTARASSSLFVCTNNTPLKDDCFKILAKSYKLSGRSFSELCEHNNNVASSLSLHKHAKTWSILNALYSHSISKAVPTGGIGGGIGPTVGNTDVQTVPTTAAVSSSTQPTAINPKADTMTSQTGPLQDQSTLHDDDESSSSSSEDEVPKLMSIASGGNQGRFLPKWDFTSLIVDVLQHFAEEGDVQMSASLLIVLGDRIRHKIDEQTQELWLMSYIDLLRRLEMWSVANEITKLSSLPIVNTQNLQSTTVYASCGRCNKPLSKSGWFCKRCMSLIEPCSLCHLSVRGSYVWCQGCGHGGHLTHIQEWFSNNIWCPAGCGHICEFM